MKSAEEVERNARIVQEIESHIEGMEDVCMGGLRESHSFLLRKMSSFLLFLGHPRLGYLFSPHHHLALVGSWGFGKGLGSQF